MNFMNELSKKLGDKYYYLKLLKVVYNTTFCFCVVNFIYPENMPVLSDTEKNEIKNAVSEILNIEGKIECKFNKSYLDKKILVNKISKFIKENYDSISDYINEEHFEYSKDAISVELCLLCNRTIYDYINENDVLSKIEKFLLKNFCGDFVIKAKITGNEFDENMLAKRAINELSNVKTQARVQRYRVGEPVEVFGSEIMPLPEYIRNIKGEKSSVILAGYVSNLEEKEFLPKRNKEKGIDEKRKLYKFILTDKTGKVNCIHFCTKISQKHFKLIEDGAFILCKGDLAKSNFDGALNYSIRAISLSRELDEDEVVSGEDNKIESTDYKFVKPEPYIRTFQDNLFEKVIEYPDWIKNEKWVVFDCETTGLEPQNNDITEIGAVKIENGVITQKFQHLCKPFEPIPDKISKITGITNSMVEAMPSSYEILEDFLKFADGCTLVGYNVNFDYQFISNVAKRKDKVINFQTRDCLNDARLKVAYLPNYKLGTLVAHLGITLDNAHRALYDATATAEAFLALSLL